MPASTLRFGLIVFGVALMGAPAGCGGDDEQVASQTIAITTPAEQTTTGSASPQEPAPQTSADNEEPRGSDSGREQAGQTGSGLADDGPEGSSPTTTSDDDAGSDGGGDQASGATQDPQSRLQRGRDEEMSCHEAAASADLPPRETDRLEAECEASADAPPPGPGDDPR